MKKTIMMEKKNVILSEGSLTQAKNLFFLFIFFFPLLSYAELKSGYFEGEAHVAQNKKTAVQIFVRVTEEDPTLAFGVILMANQASLYRVEELEDSTQSWMALFSGRDHYVRANGDFSPIYKGYGTPKEKSKSKRLSLKLLSLDGNSTGGVRSIEAEQVYQKEWVALLEPNVQVHINFDQGDRCSKGSLEGSQFRGTLVFDSVSLEGSFSLTPVTPYLATVRTQVLNSQNLSGWSQSRDMVGMAFLVFDHGRRGNFLGFGAQKPKYELIFTRFLNGQSNIFEKTSLFKEGDRK
ncbi:MAG: hypothetical protein HYY61_01725 [Deltaproteobacteria bacterium]|nr:hypothetical protein [Deltaproteobacteria bacterium]